MGSRVKPQKFTLYGNRSDNSIRIYGSERVRSNPRRSERAGSDLDFLCFSDENSQRHTRPNQKKKLSLVLLEGRQSDKHGIVIECHHRRTERQQVQREMKEQRTRTGHETTGVQRKF